MKPKIFLIFLAIFLGCSAVFAQSQIQLLSGLEGGTYNQLANDIKNISKLQINVYTSSGALDNYNQLIGNTPVNVTFLQYDVLLTAVAFDSKIKDYLRILLPLFLDEEIHLITLKDSKIKSLKDLKLKKVGIGAPTQGTNVTAKTIKNKTGLIWTDVEIPSSEALDALLKGEIDAFFYVGGMPVAALQAYSNQAQGKIKLVPIKDKRLKDIYTPKVIKAKTYAWQEKDVATFSVATVLVLNTQKSNPDFLKDIEILYWEIRDNVAKLQSQGHPKWKDVYYQNSEINWPYFYIPPKSDKSVQ